MKRNALVTPCAAVVIVLLLQLKTISTDAQQEPTQQVPIIMNLPVILNSNVEIGDTRTEISFEVSAAESLSLEVIVPINNPQFLLLDPNGTTQISSGDPRLQYIPGNTIQAGNQLPGGIFIIEKIPTQIFGAWKIVLNYPAVSYKTIISTTAIIETDYKVGITIDKETFLVGENASIGLITLNKGVPITGLSPVITIVQLNPAGSSINLSAQDNGNDPDGLLDDGIYSVDYTFQTPGTYQITGSTTITTPQGNAVRTASYTITVKNPSIAFQNSTFSSTTGAGGCISAVNFNAVLNVNDPGEYIVTTTLQGNNGKQITTQKGFSLNAGSANVTLSFPARDILSEIGVNGPYVISSMSILRVDLNDTASLEYSNVNIATSSTILLNNLCIQPIQINQSVNINTIIQNGFISQVNFGCQIRVSTAGSYTISFKLVDKDGNDIGIFSYNRQLISGLNNVSFLIPALHFLNNDGPYQIISLLAYGPSGSDQLTRVGSTNALQRWQFFSSLIGDLSNDGHVDIIDYELLRGYLNQPALTPSDRRDLNFDGVINEYDLETLLRYCSRTPCEPAVNVGPGTNFPATSQINSQAPGSVLIYPVYSSGVNVEQENSKVTLTNTNPLSSIYVHLFFIDGTTCSVADNYVRLTGNQTTTFLMSDLDPQVRGYLIAIATDENGCPVRFNWLIGDILVKFSSNHQANLPAIVVPALPGYPVCLPNATTATIQFNGVSYGGLPQTLAVSSIASRLNLNETMLILNRIGGNLLSSPNPNINNSYFGLLYDDVERASSFTITSNECQMVQILSDLFPRVVPRYSQLIPNGRSGWMKIQNQTSGQAIVGSIINFNQTVQSGFSSGHNLHILSLNYDTSITIPIVRP